LMSSCSFVMFFFQAEDGIRDFHVTGVQTCALPIYPDIVRCPFGPDPFLVMATEHSFAFFPGCIVKTYGHPVFGRLLLYIGPGRRSEERRVGKACRARWAEDARKRIRAPSGRVVVTM